MFFIKSRKKELKMIWEVEKDNKVSYLVGTAHFFPYSYKFSLRRYLKIARTAIFEGPLDDDNMAKVVNAGFDSQNAYHLFDELDKKTIDEITNALRPACRDPNLFFIMDLCKLRMENPVYDMIKGMTPWLAFFTIWSSYLKKNGWKYSVDLEGYTIAKQLGKNIVFLETIEEQIKVLARLSKKRILEFLGNIDRWPILAQAYVECYLDGDLEKLRSMGLRFPSRHQSVIDHRDEIFYERIQAYLNEGEVIVFVGAPHVRGMSKLLRKDGYQIKGPRIPS
jgi:uncharacterized protein YbaP (TraB family)